MPLAWLNLGHQAALVEVQEPWVQRQFGERIVPLFNDTSAKYVTPPALTLHADLRTTSQNWPVPVLGFWDKNVGICAGAMSYRRDFRPLPGSRRSTRLRGTILPAIAFLAGGDDGWVSVCVRR